MIDFIRRFTKPNVKPLNVISIDWNKLLQNMQYLHELHPHGALFPVLKSNAYGHWLKQVCKILSTVHVPYICVDSYPEYQIVKKYSKSKALIIWETFPENYKYYDYRSATLCVYNVQTVQYLLKLWKPFSIHLFLNTWMNREWVQLQDLWVILEILKWSKSLKFEWVMSHFANADEIDTTFNEKQLVQFESMLRIIRQAWFDPERIHCWNSAGIAKVEGWSFNAWRSWLWIYWYSPLDPEDPLSHIYDELEPVMSVSSHIVSIQQLQAWDWVSYWLKWQAWSATSIAVIPFGYAEWLARSLTGKDRQVKIWDDYYPIIWTICMNLSCIYIWDASVNIWDRVEIVSSDPSAPNSLSTMASLCNTIHYEVMTGFASNIRRTII